MDIFQVSRTEQSKWQSKQKIYQNINSCSLIGLNHFAILLMIFECAKESSEPEELMPWFCVCVFWNQAQKNFTHPHTEYPWVSVTLKLCHSVTLWPINPQSSQQPAMRLVRFFYVRLGKKVCPNFILFGWRFGDPVPRAKKTPICSTILTISNGNLSSTLKKKIFFLNFTYTGHGQKGRYQLREPLTVAILCVNKILRDSDQKNFNIGQLTAV